MHHANLEKLKSLRLFGMVRALQELTGWTIAAGSTSMINSPC